MPTLALPCRARGENFGRCLQWWLFTSSPTRCKNYALRDKVTRCAQRQQARSHVRNQAALLCFHQNARRTLHGQTIHLLRYPPTPALINYRSARRQLPRKSNHLGLASIKLHDQEWIRYWAHPHARKPVNTLQ